MQQLHHKHKDHKEIGKHNSPAAFHREYKEVKDEVLTEEPEIELGMQYGIDITKNILSTEKKQCCDYCKTDSIKKAF